MFPPNSNPENPEISGWLAQIANRAQKRLAHQERLKRAIAELDRLDSLAAKANNQKSQPARAPQEFCNGKARLVKAR